MTINEALSNLHAVNVLIDAYHMGLEWESRKVDLTKVSTLLMETRKTLEKVREKDDD
jgi:hypothetical protein